MLTDDPFAKGNWKIEELEDSIELGPGCVPVPAQPYLRGKEWDQYCDPLVYKADKAFRAWAAEMLKHNKWRTTRNMRRYTYGELFMFVFGRPYERTDAKSVGKISKIFRYYCSTVGKNHYDEKRKKWIKDKTDYMISSKCLNRPAYSLRLRVEEMMANGETPNVHNMKLPKDDLQIGHSRYKKTEENKRKRSERARLAYNEYQRKQRRVRAAKAAAGELGDAGRVPDDPVPGQDDGGHSQDEGESS